MSDNLTPWEREYIIRSVITSQALSGVTVPRELAERLLDEVLAERLVRIGEAERGAALVKGERDA